MLQFSYAGWFSIMLCTSNTDMCYRLSHKSVECTTNKFNFLPLTTHKTPLLLKENHTSSLIKGSVKRKPKIKTSLTTQWTFKVCIFGWKKKNKEKEKTVRKVCPPFSEETAVLNRVQILQSYFHVTWKNWMYKCLSKWWQIYFLSVWLNKWITWLA